MVLSLTTENAFLTWTCVYIYISLVCQNQCEKATQTMWESLCISCIFTDLLKQVKDEGEDLFALRTGDIN